MATETKYEGSMNDWAEAVRVEIGDGKAELIQESIQVKTDGQAMLETLGLPRLNSTTLSVTDFLKNPGQTFQQVKSRLYHLSLLSDINNKRERVFPLRPSRVVGYIRENVQEPGSYTMILKEFHPNMYGGNILIGTDGSVILEAVVGDHIGVVLGNKRVKAFGYKDPFLRTLGIYEDPNHTIELRNQKLKQALLRTINCIPKDKVGDDGEINFHPGYYEFIIVRKGHQGLRPIFIDYRDKDIYQNPQIQ